MAWNLSPQKYPSARKSPDFKATSWTSSSLEQLCSEMSCSAAAGSKWPLLWPLTAVPPLPSEPPSRVGSHTCARIAVWFTTLSAKGLLPIWWPCVGLPPLQAGADLCQHSTSHSLWSKHLVWFPCWRKPAYKHCEKCEQILAHLLTGPDQSQEMVHKALALLVPDLCQHLCCLLQLAYQSVTQCNVPEVIALQQQ